jgi:catechol 2,3-dioxygenase-like lactoylglutathione lyase family enzyme
LPLKKLTHTQVWVLDQDEARDFYTEKLGLAVREDATLDEMGGFRWLTVGPQDQADMEIMLLVPGPPPLSEDVAEQVKSLVAQGAVSSCIFEVDDCQATYEELKGRGVEFTQEPVERFYGIDAGFRDPFGNHFRMTQRTEG